MSRPLVIDKSFAQGRSSSRLRELSSEWTLWVPSAFYFEVFDTDSVSRRSALAGFPEFRRGHHGSFLQQERQSGRPCRMPDGPILSFSEIASNVDWEPSSEINLSDALEKDRNERVSSNAAFWKTFLSQQQIPGFDESETADLHGDQVRFDELTSSLRGKARIRLVLAAMGLSHAEITDEDWYSFRLAQAWALHALSLVFLYGRHGGNLTDTVIEHHVQDLDYLTLGLHFRALATRESQVGVLKMGWRFNFLCPDGTLISE